MTRRHDPKFSTSIYTESSCSDSVVLHDIDHTKAEDFRLYVIFKLPFSTLDFQGMAFSTLRT